MTPMFPTEEVYPEFTTFNYMGINKVIKNSYLI